MKLIRRTGQVPPGGYPYKDPRTGIHHTLMKDFFDLQCVEIQRDRKRNPKLYPPDEAGGKFLTIPFIGEQLDAYSCERFGNNPKYCTDGSIQVNTNYKLGSTVAEMKCPHCGVAGQMQERICQTCGGRKVVGHICTACNKES